MITILPPVLLMNGHNDPDFFTRKIREQNEEKALQKISENHCAMRKIENAIKIHILNSTELTLVFDKFNICKLLKDASISEFYTFQFVCGFNLVNIVKENLTSICNRYNLHCGFEIIPTYSKDKCIDIIECYNILELKDKYSALLNEINCYFDINKQEYGCFDRDGKIQIEIKIYK